MSNITNTVSDTLKKVSDTVTDTAKDAGNSLDKAYKDATGTHSHSSKLTGNSGFSSDAKTLAKDAERMKDHALRDADKKF